MSKDDGTVVAWVFGGISSVGSVALLFGGFKSLRRKRLIENVPTSKVQGVFLGLTEVKGEAEDDTYLRSYLAETECVWYRYAIEEQWRKTETYTENGKTKTRTSSGWTTVKADDVRDPFHLRDDTGRIRIVPDKAEIEGETVFSRTCGRADPVYYRKGPAGSIAHTTHTRRFTEYAIRPKRRIYVIGTARLRQDVVEPEIAYGPEDEMFLISVNSEEAIVRSYAWGALLKPVFSWLLGLLAAFLILGAMGGRMELTPEAITAWVVLSITLGLVNFVHYLMTVYNGLISVRNRVAMAWSQIDIQLKRRFDLIPNLVSAVQGHVQHERSVMESLAKIRVENRLAGRGGASSRIPIGGAAAAWAGFADEQTHALAGIYGIVERYPAIQADEGFRKLAKELATTETKIALARAFFNESVTALNNRIETVPDVLIAGPAGFKKADYFKIEEFEAAPVSIKAALEEEKAAVHAADAAAKAAKAAAAEAAPGTVPAETAT